MQGQFYNPSQPQTMQGAVFLLYANVIVALFFRSGDRGLFALAASSVTRDNLPFRTATLIGNVVAVAVVAGSAGAAYLIANEKKIGWRLGVVVAIIPLLAQAILIAFGDLSIIDAIDVKLLFDVALMVLLVHTQTTSYEKVWFK